MYLFCTEVRSDKSPHLSKSGSQVTKPNVPRPFINMYSILHAILYIHQGTDLRSLLYLALIGAKLLTKT